MCAAARFLRGDTWMCRYRLCSSRKVAKYWLLLMERGVNGPQTSVWMWEQIGASRSRLRKGADVCFPSEHPVQVIFGGGEFRVSGSPCTRPCVASW